MTITQPYSTLDTVCDDRNEYKGKKSRKIYSGSPENFVTRVQRLQMPSYATLFTLVDRVGGEWSTRGRIVTQLQLFNRDNTLFITYNTYAVHLHFILAATSSATVASEIENPRT